MTTRRAIKSALYGFLGTYVSRYSDYDGYWLFGFLVPKLEHLGIDLLAESASHSETLQATAISLARDKFREQVAKAGVPMQAIGEATLEVSKLPELYSCLVAGRMREGYNITFTVRVRMDSGRVYRREICTFVAPHDASLEGRSGRALGNASCR